MSDVIADYQKWKQQGENLRGQAKHAMESRFRELLAEAVQIAEEYRADFGAVLKPPVQVTSFRYKASSKPKAKKAAKADPKVAALQKKLANAKKKLDEAKAGGAATRPLEDRVYEIEDALRLAVQ